MWRPMVLVGRDAELAQLARAVDEAKRTGAFVVVLQGPSGIGKSLLVDAAVAQLRPRVGRVVVARASPTTRAPLRALGPVLTRFLGDDLAAALLASLDPGSARVDAPIADRLALAGHRVLELTTHLVAALGRGADPDVVVVEDTQWLDATSRAVLASLVDALAGARRATRALLVLTAWTDAAAPDDPLTRALGASARTAHLTLRPLSESQEADLVRTEVPDAGVGYLGIVRRAASGHPLRVRAALTVLRQRGVPPDVALSDPRARRALWLPAQAGQEATERWLGVLDAEARRVLAHVAVFGHEFDLEDACAVVDASDVVVSALDRAVGAGVLGTDGVRYWFTHSELADAAARTVPATALALLHAASARRKQALAAAGATGHEVAIARHLLEAGAVVPVQERFDAWCRAGRSSFDATEWTDSGLFLEAALGVRPEGLDDAALLPLVLRAGLSHVYRQDVVSAVPRLREAAGLARALGDDGSWCRALVSLAWAETLLDPDPLGGGADVMPLEELLAHVDEPLLRCEALATLTEVHAAMGRPDAAAAAARAAVAAADDSADTRALVLAHHAAGVAAFSANEPAAAVTWLRSAWTASRRIPGWYVRTQLAVRLAGALVGAGELREAEAIATEALTVAETHGEHVAMAVGWGVQCQLAMLRGEREATEAAAERAAAAARRSSHGLTALSWLPAVFLARMAGEDLDGARRLVEAHGSWPMARRLARLVDAAEAAPGTAPASARRVSVGAARPRTPVQVALLAVEAERAVLVGDVDGLRRVLPHLEALVAAGLRFPMAYPVLVARLVGDVLAALGRPDRAADAYDSALAAAEESGALVEQARATYGRARVEHDRPGGSVDVVRRLCARAAALAEGLGLDGLAARAGALGRIAVDRPAAVAARGGRWCVVLVTDVVGSSLVSTEAGDSAYHRLIQDHCALVRSRAARHGGTEFSESGDGLLVSFPSTAAAVRTAFDVRDEVMIAAAREAVPQLRIALAGGEPLWEGGRPYGQVVNRASRLVALAGDGEIVADEAVAGDLPLGVAAVQRRTLALKNMGDHEVVTLVADVAPPGIVPD